MVSEFLTNAPKQLEEKKIISGCLYGNKWTWAINYLYAFYHAINYIGKNLKPNIIKLLEKGTHKRKFRT